MKIYGIVHFNLINEKDPIISIGSNFLSNCYVYSVSYRISYIVILELLASLIWQIQH